MESSEVSEMMPHPCVLLYSSVQLMEEMTFSFNLGLILIVWEFFQRMSFYTHLHFCEYMQNVPPHVALIMTFLPQF